VLGVSRLRTNEEINEATVEIPIGLINDGNVSLDTSGKRELKYVAPSRK
jgi:hypothetical protein